MNSKLSVKGGIGFPSYEDARKERDKRHANKKSSNKICSVIGERIGHDAIVQLDSVSSLSSVSGIDTKRTVNEKENNKIQHESPSSKLGIISPFPRHVKANDLNDIIVSSQDPIETTGRRAPRGGYQGQLEFWKSQRSVTMLPALDGEDSDSGRDAYDERDTVGMRSSFTRSSPMDFRTGIPPSPIEPPLDEFFDMARGVHSPAKPPRSQKRTTSEQLTSRTSPYVSASKADHSRYLDTPIIRNTNEGAEDENLDDVNIDYSEFDPEGDLQSIAASINFAPTTATETNDIGSTGYCIPPTDLHRLCQEASTLEDLSHISTMGFFIRSTASPNMMFLHKNAMSDQEEGEYATFVSSTAVKDKRGRLPLHIISENRNLILSSFGFSPHEYGYLDTSDLGFAPTFDGNDVRGVTGTRNTKTNLNQVLATVPDLSSPTSTSSPLGHITGVSATGSGLESAASTTRVSPGDLRSFARDIVLNLVSVRKQSTAERDEEGFIPFAKTIALWIEEVHRREFDRRPNASRRGQFYGLGGFGVGGEGSGENHISNQAAQIGHVVTNSISKTRASLARAVQLNSPPFSLKQLSSRASRSTSSLQQFSISSPNPTPQKQLNVDEILAQNDESSPGEKIFEEEEPEPQNEPSLSSRGGRDGSINPTTNGHPMNSEVRDRQFPTKIRTTKHVEWCLHMLSTILEYLDETSNDTEEKYSSSRAQDGFQGDDNMTTSVRRDYSMGHENFNQVGRNDDNEDATQGQSMRKHVKRKSSSSRILADSIVQHIASIPQFVKTLLLIDDDAERDRIFSLTVVRQAVLRSQSIGKWLTSMLSSKNKWVAQRAIDYLHLLSRVSDEEKHGVPWSSDAKSRQARIKRMRRNELYEAVSHLDGLIPSMLALDERMVEQAATSKIIRKVLDKMISRPFAVAVVFFDMLFLGGLIFTFRYSVHGYLNAYDPSYIIKFIYVADKGIFYFFIREVGKVVSLCMISGEFFGLKHFWSFWNLVDVLSICMALASTIIMRVCLTQGGCLLVDGGESRRACFAVTTGLLWLRVLGLLKTINMQLATFILAIVQITRDILWFLLILGVAVVSFAQMFYTLLLPGYCGLESAAAERRNCSQAEYYLKVYTILLGDLGDFDREDFATVFSVVLIVIFSFMVVIILLNVLIAIVSDSYEKCLLRSENLFGRARVVLLAELVSFQRLLLPVAQESGENVVTEGDTSEKIDKQDSWFGRLRKKGTRGSYLFVSLSAAVVAMWVLGESLGYLYAERYENFAFSMISILVNVVLLVAIIKFLSHGASRVSSRHAYSSSDPGSGFFGRWYNNSIHKIMLRLLGTSEKQKQLPSTKSSGLDEEWRGRVNYLQTEMIRATSESAMRTKEEMKALEMDMKDLESRTTMELKLLQQQLSETEARVMAKMRSSEERVEELMRLGLEAIVAAVDNRLDGNVRR